VSFFRKKHAPVSANFDVFYNGRVHMTTEDNIETLVEAANARWADGTLGEPRSTSWGMYSYGDAPAAIGGGTGAFTWFNSKTALLKFIEDVLPYSPPGPGNTDPLAVADKVRAVLRNLRSGDLELDEARRRLNTVLRAHSQIEWMGTFKDLKDGNDAYARELIKQFRRSRELAVGTAPVAIARSQIEDFKEFLAEYGI